MKSHLIFDFDGVLADTFDLVHAICKELDPNMTHEDFLAHHDGNVYESPRVNLDEEKTNLFISNYRERLTPSHIKQATPWIHRFAETHTLHIISSNVESALCAVLDEAGVSTLFTTVLGKETDHSKVAKFELLKHDHGISASNTLFVTDTLGDIHEAKKVGLPVIAVTFGYHNRERLAKGEPDHLVDSWEEIRNVIETPSP